MEIAVTVSEDVDDGVGDDNSLSVDEEGGWLVIGINDTNFSFVVSVS